MPEPEAKPTKHVRNADTSRIPYGVMESPSGKHYAVFSSGEADTLRKVGWRFVRYGK